MLNEMFKEIAEILGDEYGLFREFNPNSMFTDEMLDKYKHLGVLYLNDGNPNFIPDAASMTINYTLTLCMRVEVGQNTAAMTVDPLERLSAEMTGNVYSEGKKWTYVLNVGLPQSDGVLNVGAGVQFVHYDIPITAVVASGVLLSNNSKITVTVNDTATPLKAVVSAVEVPETQLESAVFVNDYVLTSYTYKAGAIESTPVAKGWALRVIKLYNPSDAADKYLRAQSLSDTPEELKITYAMGDETATAHRCYISECTFSNEQGQAVIMSFTLTSAMRPF